MEINNIQKYRHQKEQNKHALERYEIILDSFVENYSTQEEEKLARIDISEKNLNYIVDVILEAEKLIRLNYPRTDKIYLTNRKIKTVESLIGRFLIDNEIELERFKLKC